MRDLFSEILGGLIAFVLAMVIGAMLMHGHDAKELNALTASYHAAYAKADAAREAAEVRATTIEKSQAGAIADAIATYKETRTHEKAHDDAVIADLRNDVTRLRVRTNHPAACGGPLPGAAAGAAGTDGAGDETLAGPVAARLAGRYADYNRLVDKLTGCQAVIAADRLAPATE